MLDFYIFKREDYTLLIVEENKFEISDLVGVIKKVRAIESTKRGIAIAAAPETNLVVISDLFTYFANPTRCLWLGAYIPQLNKGGILISNSFGNPDYVRSKFIDAQLPCLECYRQGQEVLLVKPKSKHPYCRIHFDLSPHRKISRTKPIGVTNVATASTKRGRKHN